MKFTVIPTLLMDHIESPLLHPHIHRPQFLEDHKEKDLCGKLFYELQLVASDEPGNCLNLLPNQLKIIMFHALLDKWMALEFPLLSFLHHAERDF